MKREIQKIDKFLNFYKSKVESLVSEYNKGKKKTIHPILKLKEEKRFKGFKESLSKILKKISTCELIEKRLYFLKFYFEEILNSQFNGKISILQYNKYNLQINFPQDYAIGFYSMYKNKPGPVFWVENPGFFCLKKLFKAILDKNIYNPFERPICKSIILHKHTLAYVLTKEFSLQSRITRNKKKCKNVLNNVFRYVKK